MDLDKEFEKEIDLDTEFESADNFDSEISSKGAIESASSAQSQISTPENEKQTSKIAETLEAGMAAYTEMLPGLRGAVAGIGAEIGEAFGGTPSAPITSYGGKGTKLPEAAIQPPMVGDKPVEPIQDYMVLNPEGKSIPVSEAPSTFNEARMQQIKYDQQLFEDNKMISVLGAIAGPGVNLSKIAKKSPAIIAKMADKSPKLAAVLEKILPNASKLERAERLQKTFDRFEQYGKFKKLDKFKSAASKLKAAQAAEDALKMGTIAGFTYSEDPVSLQAV
ncbi:hypothetical protein, partial [Nocardia mangyaensis]|uniref:hypothetical protein n=1 Tax=Nocardia mangyaensis TaxID=2213200 RepID=UPI002676F75A